MQRLTFIMCAAIGACSGPEPSRGTTTLTVNVAALNTQEPHESVVDVTPSAEPGVIIAKSCLAIPFEDSGDDITKLGLCEMIAWHIGLCETWKSGSTKGMDRCDEVKVEDRRRMEVQAECMSWQLSDEEVKTKHKAAHNCFYYKVPTGTSAYTCVTAMPCLQGAGFSWTPRSDWSELLKGL